MMKICQGRKNLYVGEGWDKLKDGVHRGVEEKRGTANVKTRQPRAKTALFG